MHYTLSPETLRNLANEMAEDLSNTYEHLNDEGVTLEDLKYWELRRELLLHQYGRCLVFAEDLEKLNRIQTERTNASLEQRYREAAE